MFGLTLASSVKLARMQLGNISVLNSLFKDPNKAFENNTALLQGPHVFYLYTFAQLQTWL